MFNLRFFWDENCVIYWGYSKVVFELFVDFVVDIFRFVLGWVYLYELVILVVGEVFCVCLELFLLIIMFF